MHATFHQLDFSDGEASFVSPRSGEAERRAADRFDWQHGGGYGRRRLRLGSVAVILLVHAALFTALIQLDVVTVHRKTTEPLVVTLVPEQAPPPPAAPPEKALKPVEPIKPRIVAPAPVVAVPRPAPVELAVVREPPPQADVVAVAPPAPAVPPAPPAPVTPPDGSAASLRNPAPRYPVESRRKREEGTVRLRVVISPDGRVETISLARSSGFDRLDEVALETVRKWKFKPGMQAGVAVEAVGFLLIPFKITD